MHFLLDFSNLVPQALNFTKELITIPPTQTAPHSLLLFSVMVFSQSYRNEILALFFPAKSFSQGNQLSCCILVILSKTLSNLIPPYYFLPHLSALFICPPGCKHFHKSHTWTPVYYLYNPPPLKSPHLLLSPHLAFS